MINTRVRGKKKGGLIEGGSRRRGRKEERKKEECTVRTIGTVDKDRAVTRTSVLNARVSNIFRLLLINVSKDAILIFASQSQPHRRY